MELADTGRHPLGALVNLSERRDSGLCDMISLAAVCLVWAGSATDRMGCSARSVSQ